MQIIASSVLRWLDSKRTRGDRSGRKWVLAAWQTGSFVLIWRTVHIYRRHRRHISNDTYQFNQFLCCYRTYSGWTRMTSVSTKCCYLQHFFYACFFIVRRLRNTKSPVRRAQSVYLCCCAWPSRSCLRAAQIMKELLFLAVNYRRAAPT